MKKLIILFLLISIALSVSPKAFACKAARDAYIASGAGAKHRFPWATVSLGSIYSIQGAHYALYNVIHDIPRLNKWAEISKFEENTFVSREMSNIFQDEEVPVKTLKNSINKTDFSSNIYGNDKVCVVENFDIKNNALHLHYIKVPEELANSKQKLIAETFFVYENPDKTPKLNCNFSKKSRLRYLERTADKKQKKTVETSQGNNIFYVKKDYKIKSGDKSFVLAVYPLKNKEAKEKIQYSCGKYAAFVKFRAVN
jgi:hypothetical protein